MKRVFLFALIALAFASCKKCYTCVTAVSVSGQGSATGSHEFCGTKQEKEDHVRAGNTTTTAYSGGIKVTQTTKTSCN